MNPIDNTVWDAALERLLDDVYAFARTGPRRHDDWGRDVLDVMDRSVTDPRGLQTLEWQIDKKGRENIRPSYPFLPLTAEQVHAWTYPVTASAAAALLASLTQEWFFEARPVRTRADRDDVMADACSVLVAGIHDRRTEAQGRVRRQIWRRVPAVCGRTKSWTQIGSAPSGRLAQLSAPVADQ